MERIRLKISKMVSRKAKHGDVKILRVQCGLPEPLMFTPDCRVATDKGFVAVGKLKPGDIILAVTETLEPKRMTIK